MKQLILSVACSVCLWASAQTYNTQVFEPTIKTLQIHKLGEKFGIPMIELNGSEQLQVSFDELSHKSHFYTYKVIHCNADWSPSSIISSEYVGSFSSASITDITLSLNTTVLYTHYRFNLPNDDVKFKISGNYVVLIYEDDAPDKPVAQACFTVVDPKVQVTGKIRGNTDTELSGRLQQLDFDILMNGYTVKDQNSELKVLVRQNNRIDNQVTDLKPTFISGSKVSYMNNKELIFEGGNEYRRFDISSVYAAGEGVNKVEYNRVNYDAYLVPAKLQGSKLYMQDQDVNGRYVINLQRSDDDETEADYMAVHFFIPAEAPFFDGSLYIGGDWNNNLLNDESRLKYDNDAKAYYQRLVLKQGGYNYQYWFAPKGSKKASVERVEGSFWQTRNEYTIYVYHRAWGERYDRLICVKTIE